MQTGYRKMKWVLGAALWGLVIWMPLAAQTPAQQPFMQDLSVGPRWFPMVQRPYQEQPMAAMTLENSVRLRDLIRDGQMELSLANALALAIENNLDIAVQRFVRPMAQADVLRTRSGQAARGFQGAFVPGGLQTGALGAGVPAARGGGGLGGGFD